MPYLNFSNLAKCRYYSYSNVEVPYVSKLDVNVVVDHLWNVNITVGGQYKVFLHV